MTVILLAHGSPDPRHARDVASLAARLTAWGTPTRAAYLEHDDPRPARLARALDPGPSNHALTPAPNARTALAASERAHDPAVNGRTAHAAVVPLFVAPAYHVRVDVPAAVRAMRDAAPLLQLVVAEPVGLHPMVLDAAAELGIKSGHPIGPSTGILLVAAGSRNRQAVGAVEDLVATHGPAMAQRLGARAVGAAYLDGGPSLAQAAEELSVAEGCDTVLVITLTVADGILRDRLTAAASEQGLAVAPGTLSDTTCLAHLVRLRARDAAG